MLHRIKVIFAFLWNYAVDCYRAIVQGCYSPWGNPAQQTYYRLLITGHAVEKGLSLRDRRTEFGKARIDELFQLLGRYASLGQTDPFPARFVVGILRAYVRFNREAGVQSDWIRSVETRLERHSHWLPPESDESGAAPIQVFPADRQSLAIQFLESRRSTRIYAPGVVEAATIQSIVRIANRAPSQCNRQSVHVRCFTEPERIRRLVELQGGGSCFLSEIHNLFLVSSDLSAWGGVGQRSQAYVDGGLFSQQLLLAIHAHGLLACPLNLAVTNRREAEICDAAGMPRNERLIMMIAFGYPDGRSVAAGSHRQAASMILRK